MAATGGLFVALLAAGVGGLMLTAIVFVLVVAKSGRSRVGEPSAAGTGVGSSIEAEPVCRTTESESESESETEPESEPESEIETETETESEPVCRTTESETESEPVCRTTESESETESEPVCRTTEIEIEETEDTLVSDDDDGAIPCAGCGAQVLVPGRATGRRRRAPVHPRLSPVPVRACRCRAKHAICNT